MDNRKIHFCNGGFFGAPLEEIAGRLAEDEDAELISLDEEISRDDGRSILQLTGEHEYKNKEYEALQRLTGPAAAGSEDSVTCDCNDEKNIVVQPRCHDDMSAEIIKNGHRRP